jgi:hypothetical protein
VSAWYRVFGRSEEVPGPQALLEHLAGLGVAVRGRFLGEGAEWDQATLELDGGQVDIDRYPADDEGIRAELNGWAAYLETCEDSPHAAGLMERVVQARHLFTVRRSMKHADEERVCVGVCRFLAEMTDGLWQADGAGFFEANGRLVVAERE